VQASGRKTREIRSCRPPQLPQRDLLIAVVDVEEVRAWQPLELEAAI